MLNNQMQNDWLRQKTFIHNLQSERMGTMEILTVAEQVKELSLRKIERLKSLGLERQAKILLAEINGYKSSKLLDLVPRIFGRKSSDYNILDIKDIFKTDRNAWAKIEINGGSYIGVITAIDNFNLILPHAAVDAYEEAKNAGCFDRFLIMCPREMVMPEIIQNPDPIIIGMIESGITNGDLYYPIFGWDITK